MTCRLLGLACLVAVAAAAGPPPALAGVGKGDGIDEVLTALGAPRGEMRRGDYYILYYDLGIVLIKDGRVIFTDLITPAELARQKQAARDRQAAQRAERLRIEQERTEQGRAAKAERLRDPAFLALSPRRQYEAWQAFRTEYPNVPVDEQLAALEPRVREQEWKEREEKQQELVGRIKALDEEIAHLRTRRGVSWGELARTRRRLPRLRQERASLLKQLDVIMQEPTP